jgi:3-phosphoshikimate 1-carboxyvinyltransferase
MSRREDQPDASSDREDPALEQLWLGLARGDAALPEVLEVPAGRVARGSVTPPASKSVSHRYLNLALLCDREMTVENPLAADDIALLTQALIACGVKVERLREGVHLVPSSATRAAAEPRRIECGNAGTMFRFFTATLTTLPGVFVLDGTPRLRERPIAPLVDALRALGAGIEYLEDDGHAPLRIQGQTLRGGRCQLDASSSSQYLSALLMAAVRAAAPIEIEVQALTSEPYVAITLAALENFGLPVPTHSQGCWRVAPSQAQVLRGGPGRVRVESDLSAAAYPAAAAAITGGAVTIRGVDARSVQGDRRLFEVLAAMGARVRWTDDTLVVEGGPLRGVTADLSDIPDQVPTVAAVACFAGSRTRIDNVAHLRVKESDRLAAMAIELGKAGFLVEERSDGLTIEPAIAAERGPGVVAPCAIDAHDDHRIAMSLALVGLRRPHLSVRDPIVVGKSYPGFWHDLASLLF